jgi:hypothetical protein
MSDEITRVCVVWLVLAVVTALCLWSGVDPPVEMRGGCF